MHNADQVETGKDSHSETYPKPIRKSLTAADETHRRHAVAAVVHGPFRGFDQPRVVRKSEVVVGAEIKYLTTCNFDLRALRRFDDPFALVEPCSLDFSKFLLQVFFDFSVHIR